MGATLERTICAFHPSRVAVVRCPQCGDTYCDECVTEHEGRMVCRKCLDQVVEQVQVQTKRRHFSIARGAQWVLGAAWGALMIYLLWMVFYVAGSALIELPSDFHEGTLWLEGGL